MERRFACTACGRCCVGVLPLTLAEAITHAGRFPLAVLLTPVRQGHKAFATTARLGRLVRLDRRRELAVRIAPVSYLAPEMPCPALGADGLCRIQAAKPSRCRTMPFYPYRAEDDQAAMLIPRPGWACDVSAAAPVVYRDKSLIDRTDFDAEAGALRDQAPILRAFADHLVASVPGFVDTLISAAAKPVGGDLLVGFAALLRRLDGVDRSEIARRQIPVLTAFAARVADDPARAEFRRHYQTWTRDIERFARP
jgi:Fe-S-cluster containining protein